MRDILQSRYLRRRVAHKQLARTSLRAVPTIVIAHTFCVSRDTQIFLSVMLSNTEIFLRGLKLSLEKMWLKSSGDKVD